MRAAVHDALISTLSGKEEIRLQPEVEDMMNLVVSKDVGSKRAERKIRKVAKESVNNLNVVEDILAKVSS